MSGVHSGPVGFWSQNIDALGALPALAWADADL
jgi:hypothetical protein